MIEEEQVINTINVIFTGNIVHKPKNGGFAFIPKPNLSLTTPLSDLAKFYRAANKPDEASKLQNNNDSSSIILFKRESEFVIIGSAKETHKNLVKQAPQEEKIDEEVQEKQAKQIDKNIQGDAPSNETMQNDIPAYNGLFAARNTLADIVTEAEKLEGVIVLNAEEFELETIKYFVEDPSFTHEKLDLFAERPDDTSANNFKILLTDPSINNITCLSLRNPQEGFAILLNQKLAPKNNTKTIESELPPPIINNVQTVLWTAKSDNPFPQPAQLNTVLLEGTVKSAQTLVEYFEDNKEMAKIYHAQSILSPQKYLHGLLQHDVSEACQFVDFIFAIPQFKTPEFTAYLATLLTTIPTYKTLRHKLTADYLVNDKKTQKRLELWNDDDTLKKALDFQTNTIFYVLKAAQENLIDKLDFNSKGFKEVSKTLCTFLRKTLSVPHIIPNEFDTEWQNVLKAAQLNITEDTPPPENQIKAFLEFLNAALDANSDKDPHGIYTQVRESVLADFNFKSSSGTKVNEYYAGVMTYLSNNKFPNFERTNNDHRKAMLTASVIYLLGKTQEPTETAKIMSAAWLNRENVQGPNRKKVSGGLLNSKVFRNFGSEFEKHFSRFSRQFYLPVNVQEVQAQDYHATAIKAKNTALPAYKFYNFLQALFDELALPLALPLNDHIVLCNFAATLFALQEGVLVTKDKAKYDTSFTLLKEFSEQPKKIINKVTFQTVFENITDDKNYEHLFLPLGEAYPLNIANETHTKAATNMLIRFHEILPEEVKQLECVTAYGATMN